MQSGGRVSAVRPGRACIAHAPHPPPVSRPSVHLLRRWSNTVVFLILLLPFLDFGYVVQSDPSGSAPRALVRYANI